MSIYEIQLFKKIGSFSYFFISFCLFSFIS